MHASLGPIRGSQTVGSMVSKLQPDGLCTHWLTGTAAPCTGIFKPMWVDAVPDVGALPTGSYDEASLFWQHEMLHREVLRAFEADWPPIAVNGMSWRKNSCGKLMH